MRGSYEYTARIRFDPQEVPGRFIVIVFLGDIPEDPKDWLLSPSCVGSVSKYTATFPGPQGSLTKSEGFVAIPNDVILERSGLSSLEPAIVRPYLDRELEWRVQKIDFEYTPITLKSLEVDVLTRASA